MTASFMKEIFTVGHSTRPIDDYLELLKAHHIELLVDIRTFPGSRRYPQFNSAALAKSLNENGIKYEHLLSLGGRRSPRPDSPNTAWRNSGFRGYADYMMTSDFKKGLEHLIEIF